MKTKLEDLQTCAIIEAAMEVHTQLGCGFPEAPYGEALAREFLERAIPFEAQVKLSIPYKGSPLRSYFRVDFVCYQKE